MSTKKARRKAIRKPVAAKPIAAPPVEELPAECCGRCRFAFNAGVPGEVFCRYGPPIPIYLIQGNTVPSFFPSTKLSTWCGKFESVGGS